MNEDGKMRNGLLNNFDKNIPGLRQEAKLVTFRSIFHICLAANGNV